MAKLILWCALLKFRCIRFQGMDGTYGGGIVEIEVPGMYAGLRVPLPKHPAVDDDEATARFDSKQRTLKLFLPTKS